MSGMPVAMLSLDWQVATKMQEDTLEFRAPSAVDRAHERFKAAGTSRTRPDVGSRQLPSR